MTKRKGEASPEPPGGGAAARLRQFEEARRPQDHEGETAEETSSQEAQVILEEFIKHQKGGSPDEGTKRPTN